MSHAIATRACATPSTGIPIRGLQVVPSHHVGLLLDCVAGREGLARAALGVLRTPACDGPARRRDARRVQPATCRRDDLRVLPPPRPRTVIAGSPSCYLVALRRDELPGVGLEFDSRGFGSPSLDRGGGNARVFRTLDCMLEQLIVYAGAAAALRYQKV
jgi:hypothetical protein